MECGDHGKFNPALGECDCFNGWDGTVCQVPPGNIKCVPSDAAFRAAHQGGDLECGNMGMYGTCNTDGTCTCTNGFSGTRCERECTMDAECGGSTQTRAIGVCNAFNRCECKNGWSGVQCRIAPPDVLRCTTDDDCGWGGQHGKCGPDKLCKCDVDTKNNRPMYEGAFCEKLVIYEGAPCDRDEKCKGGLKCLGGKCYNPNISPANQRSQIIEAIKGFFTLENLALMYGQNKAEEMLLKLTQWGLDQVLPQLLVDRAEELVSKEAFEAMTKYLPEAMCSRVAARLAAKAVAEQTETMAAELIVEEAVAAALGGVFTVLGMFQIFGVILDIADVRGLNQQMLQSMLDQVQVSFYQAYNTSPNTVEKKAYLPAPYSPTKTVEFQVELQSEAMKTQQAEDAAKYLSALKINSNGDLIQPLFLSLAESQFKNKVQRHKLYWSMSGHNEVILDRLIQYGWMFWLLVALVAVSVVLTGVFGSSAVQARLRR
jgi:hypothetical protein